MRGLGEQIPTDKRGGFMKPIAIVAMLAVMASASATGTRFAPIDLNRPGAMEQLRSERPAHYEAISAVLRVVERLPCRDREIQSLSARFDIRDLACYAALMTSYPPKRRVSFELEGSSYVVVVTMKGTEGELTPASPAAR